MFKNGHNELNTHSKIPGGMIGMYIANYENVGESEMKKLPLIIIVIFGSLSVSGVQSLSAQNWPQWRGPLATDAALSGDPPVEWSEEKNVRWKIRLSGTGKSTPAVCR